MSGLGSVKLEYRRPALQQHCNTTEPSNFFCISLYFLLNESLLKLYFD